ncbi:clathrin interactor EPSIN 1-like [Dendrobium catenatum]|uniref:clathrin interactor EPSIN 1-like n=1 Tax=Dendrobium catenatum TaxID=906689 RepID=UPI00109EF0DE|nr:clathrin interactor EPSIN 1-like [Dendrobium catenatum]
MGTLRLEDQPLGQLLELCPIEVEKDAMMKRANEFIQTHSCKDSIANKVLILQFYLYIDLFILLGKILNHGLIQVKPTLNCVSYFFFSASLQANVNLFANQSASPATFHSDADLFAAANSGLFTETKSSNPTNISSFDPFAASDSIFSSSSESNVPSTNPTSSCAIDPFAAIQVSNVTGSDELFGSFTSNTAPASRDPSKDSSNTSQSASKKEPFQVKSGIWADSLSRGLIDLNITARNVFVSAKKTNLADIGIVGGLTDESNEKERALPPPSYMGRAMGAGSGLGRTTGLFSSTTTTGENWDFSTFQS